MKYLINKRMNMEIINLTGHDIYVRTNEGEAVFKSDGSYPRIKIDYTLFDTIKTEGVEIDICKSEFKEVYNLPEKREGVYYIVPLPIALTAKDRDDLIFPTGLVRDENGVVKACKGFAKI